MLPMNWWVLGKKWFVLLILISLIIFFKSFNKNNGRMFPCLQRFLIWKSLIISPLTLPLLVMFLKVIFSNRIKFGCKFSYLIVLYPFLSMSIEDSVARASDDQDLYSNVTVSLYPTLRNYSIHLAGSAEVWFIKYNLFSIGCYWNTKNDLFFYKQF